MKQAKDIALGVITAIGGFIDAGQLLTNSQAGALFRFGLLWTVPLCVLMASVYEEMAARVSMSTGYALFDAIRQRLGFRLALVPLGAMCAVNLLTLVAELAGMSYALQLATDGRVDYRVWAPLCALALWFVLLRGKFSLIENGASALGLFVCVYAYAAWKAGPDVGEMVSESVRPRMHGQSVALYLFMATALIGAFVSPFQILFYSSGAVEEKWDRSYKWANRVIAYSGNIFGGVVAACVLIVGAVVLFPKHQRVETIPQTGDALFAILGQTPRVAWLFIAALLFCSAAAGLQVALSASYAVAEYFGWHWKKDEPPVRSAMFHIVHTIFVIAALLIVLSSIDPGGITQAAMVFNAVALPFCVFPLLLVAGDKRFARTPLTNGWGTTVLGWVFFLVITVAAIAGVPLFLITKGGSE